MKETWQLSQFEGTFGKKKVVKQQNRNLIKTSIAFFLNI